MQQVVRYRSASPRRRSNTFYYCFAVMIALLLSSFMLISADEAPFFQRQAKWTNLAPSGGSLVSGRGNFRPGFASHADRRFVINEPLFAFKRSAPHIFPEESDWSL